MSDVHLKCALDTAYAEWHEHKAGSDEEAQRLARELAVVRGTTHSAEWEGAMDRYQRWIVMGE